MTIIKPATLNDAALLSRIGAQTFTEAYSDVKDATDIAAYIKQAFVAEAIRKSIEKEEARYFIAFVDTQAVGYTKLRTDRTHENLTTNSHAIELERIYVCKDFWKKHVGAALMQHALQYSKQHHFEVLWLGVWQQNKRAIAFYFKMGFEIFGTKKFYVGTEENDDYVMKYNL